MRVLWPITQVAEEIGESTSCIRFWERKFPEYIKSVRGEMNDVRKYDRQNYCNIRMVRYLLRDELLTLKGARKKLKLDK